MSEYTAEQIERIVSDIRSRAILVGEKAEILSMLRAYAALIREREKAREGVTDEEYP